MKLKLLDCALAGLLAGMAAPSPAQEPPASTDAPIATGSASIALAGDGVVWATEDPTLGQATLSLSVPSIAAFDAGRLAKPVDILVRGNYTAFVERYELRIYRASDADRVAPIATIPIEVAPLAKASWNGEVQDDRQPLRTGDALVFVLRAYDEANHFDETHPRALQLVRPDQVERAPPAGQAIAEVFAADGLRLQNIPIRGSRIRIQGRNIAEGQALAINGEDHPIDRERKFVAEFLVPVGRHAFAITTGGGDAQAGASHTLVLDVTGKYFFGIGLADLTIARNDIRGAASSNPGDGRDDDITTDGRLAFYGKAKWRGKYLITAQADTTERDLEDLFDGFGQADPRDIFRRLDPDLYYPTYGDDSTTWRDVDTMGRFYLRVDWDRNQALWGNYATGLTGTEFAQYVRALYGAALDWRSRGINAWGDPATQLRLFGAQAETAPGHNEFLGTGGSLYYLRNTDILPGSDSVVLEVRDPTTGRVEIRVPLQRGADYEIDELQGRILLSRPLAQITRDNLPTLTRDTPLDGFEQRLVVDYEWVPHDFDAGEVTAGVRVKHWFGDHVGIGTTYVDEQRAGEDYALAAGDITLQAGKGTYLKAEYAQSESFGVPVFHSDNGGFDFTQVNDTGAHREGNARSIEARANFGELGWTRGDWSAGAWWRDVGAGFSANRYASHEPLTEYGAEVIGHFTPDLRLQARYSRAERGADAFVQAHGGLEWRIDARNTLAGEVRRVDETSAGVDAAGLLAALKYTRQVGNASDVYGLLQATLDDDEGRYADNDAVAIGGHHRFGDRSSVGADLSTGDRGQAATVNAEYHIDASHSIYGGYTYSTDSTAPLSPFDPHLQDGWTVGQRWRLSDQVNLHNETQFLKEPAQSGLAHTFGLDFVPRAGWNLGFTLQAGELDAGTGVVERRAASVGGGRVTADTDWNSKIEWRRDSGAEQREQWVGTHRFAYKINRSWRVMARLNHADTDDRLNANAGAHLVEGNVGFAYRPWNSTRWGLFGRYTYLYDLATLAQEGGAEVDQKTRVLSLEGVYQWNPRWASAAKLARRDGHVRAERGTGPWFDAATDFAAAQLRCTLRMQWHALVEYRWLHVHHDGGTQRGALVGVDRDIGAHLRLGAGYNFTDFSDDLTEFGDGHRGWFVSISGRY